MNKLVMKSLLELDKANSGTTALLATTIAKAFVYGLLALVQEVRTYNSYHIPNQNRKSIDEEVQL